MSILIKGMKMPKAGQVIEIAQNVDGSMFARLEPSYDHWHEIVEVPTPHGRLGDIDLIIDRINGLFRTRDYDAIDFYNHATADCLATVRNTPAIIEAEEGAENG